MLLGGKDQVSISRRGSICGRVRNNSPFVYVFPEPLSTIRRAEVSFGGNRFLRCACGPVLLQLCAHPELHDEIDLQDFRSRAAYDAHVLLHFPDLQQDGDLDGTV
jgi:hypothetical protein